jgi:excisionase family DNA binding protein
MSNTQSPPLVRTGELAHTLNVRPETIRRWARQGTIPAIRIRPKTIRFDLSSVLDAIAKRASGMGKGVSDGK